MSKKTGKIKISNSSDPKEQSIYLKEEGNRYFAEEKYDRAIEMYSNAILLDTSNPIFYSNRSACFLAIGDYKSSLTDALKSIDLNPGFVKGYFRAALSLSQMNIHDKALEMLERCQGATKEEKEEFELLRGQILHKKEEEEFYQKNYSSYPKFVSFFKWLDEGNVYYPKLELKFYSDDHRGVCSKSKIQKDELIVKIPLNMLITLEMAKESPIGVKMLNANLDLLSPKHCYLSTFLLLERIKEDSKWKNYMDILPKNYDNFPIFYNDEERKWLEGSPFLAQINDKISDIQIDYNMILAVAPEFEKFSIKEFSEMRMAVSSRIFGIKVSGRKTDCFAPLADMLNHKRPRQTQWFYSDDLKSFVIQAIQDINKNEQVFDSYGKKCNTRFLLNYGFIVENNDGNEFPLTVELNSNLPLFSYKLNLLFPSKETKKTFRLQATFEEQSTLDFLSYLRFINFDEDVNIIINLLVLNKNEHSDSSEGKSFYNIPPISIKNEVKVLSHVQTLCSEALKKYETDLEFDMNLLKEEDEKSVENRTLSSNLRNCLLMRIGEKQILTFFLDFSKYMMNLISEDLTAKEIKKKLKKDFPSHNDYEFYINEVVLQLMRSKNNCINI